MRTGGRSSWEMPITISKATFDKYLKERGKHPHAQPVPPNIYDAAFYLLQNPRTQGVRELYGLTGPEHAFVKTIVFSTRKYVRSHS